MRATPPAAPRSFAALRRFVRPAVPVQQCELCSQALAREHRHLLDLSSRQLLCCCEACAILFSGQQSARYRRVPRGTRFLPDFRMTDAQWDGLLIPIAMAFFFHSSTAGRVVALYPSPAGAMESLLTLEAWQELVEANPLLREFEPDVEALLVNRLGAARDCYRVPIDECYKLVGLLRANWRGLAGGQEVWAAIGQFFGRLKEQSHA